MDDRTNTISAFQQNWLEQQQKLLNDWLETLQLSTGSRMPGSLWKMIDVMEDQIDRTLDMQESSLLALTENAENVEDLPVLLSQCFRQMEEGIEQWNDVQRRLWSVWFDMLRTAFPVKEQPGEPVLNNWQDFIQQAISIQEQWISGWTGFLPNTNTATKNKSTKSPATRRTSRTKTVDSADVGD